MFRKIFSLAFIFSFFLSLSAQSSIRLGVLTGISCAPCAYLIENRSKLSVQNMEFQIFDSAQSELPKLLRGEIDVAFLAPENAAKVFEKTKGSIVALGVVQNGNMSLLANDELYTSLEDLKGQTILCSSENNDFLIFKSLLEKKGFSLSDNAENQNAIHLDFSVPTANIANHLIQKKTKYALLSEPYATVAQRSSNEVRRSENIQKIYNESEDWSSFPALLLVARTEFTNQNKDVIRRFIDVYKNAVQWTIKNPSKAALLAEKHKLAIASPIIRQAIPNSALLWRDAGASKGDIEKYLKMLIDGKSLSAPKALPSEEFYF